jgi:two-component system, LytTR family, sensor histidine kinase AlgZ
VLTYREQWGHVAAWTAAAAVTVTVLVDTFTGRPSWAQLLQQSFANVIFSAICATLCVVLLPKVALFAKRMPNPALGWTVIAATLVPIGALGSLLAMAVAVVLGIVPLNRFFAEWYPTSLRTSVYFTMIFGLAGTIIEELRQRLASTTLTLRTKERDEAEARRLATEAQLASLESRVDPHFLFNTLNSIAALVREKPADAERVIEQLSSLMRSSLDRRASLVSLDDELDLVRSYLDIERIRFGDRLRFHIESLAGSGTFLVPRLSLQTLVENSVKFAVSPSREGASVSVKAAAIDGRLLVSVEDDGPGFDTTMFPEGHGLQLLRSRLAMTFGDRARLLLDSRHGSTTVTLDLPFETSL